MLKIGYLWIVVQTTLGHIENIFICNQAGRLVIFRQFFSKKNFNCPLTESVLITELDQTLWAVHGCNSWLYGTNQYWLVGQH